ncbi:MAG: lysozyme [Alphaproteobacteria bacterium]
MEVSTAGLRYIASWEACYLYAYPDPASGGEPWTIGIGATRYDGQGNVKRGQTITIARAVARFRETINKKYAPGVNSAINVPVSQAEFDALVSFHYNTGKIKSGTVDNKLNRGDRAAALATWRSYRLAAGRVMRGLINRRASEIALFKTGEYPARKIVLHTAPGARVRYLDEKVFDIKPTRVTIEAFPPQTEDAQKRRLKDGNFLIQLGEFLLCLLFPKTRTPSK